MAIDIFSIQPSVISRDLSGKSFFIYGDKKSGKTSNAVKFPKPILVAFEKGYNMLSGVMAQPINKWKEALDVKKQLLKDAKAVEDGTMYYGTLKFNQPPCELFIDTFEGTCHVRVGDYIIKNIDEEINSCKSDVFEKTYEIVE